MHENNYGIISDYKGARWVEVMKIDVNRRVLLIVCLLTLIFICSFSFRFFLLTRNVLPPSDDIGQHATYVNLILRFGFPSWNPYHMVGEPVVRPLVFHYLASFVSIIFHVNSVYAILYTGLFFSALTSVTLYPFAKRLTGRDSLAFLCAGLYGLNFLDIEMLSSGGYPNIAGLALIPLVFHFFLGTSKKSRIVTALLIPALSTIDHSSFLVCTLTLGVYLIFLLVKRGLRKALTLAMPVSIGITISTPYLMLYGMRIYVFTFATRLMLATYPGILGTLHFLLLFMQRTVFFMPFLFAGIYTLRSKWKRFLLFWTVVPLILMLVCYLLGAYVFIGRLAYFLSQPLMIFTASGFYAFFVGVRAYLQKLTCKIKAVNINRKRGNVAFALIIVTTVIILQLQMFYQLSMAIADYYQTVREGEYEALRWIIGHTEESDVFVSKHAFGWWINGYAQRPCLCYIPFVWINLPWQVRNSEDARKILYLEEGYADLINEYSVKYVVLHFNEVSGLPPSDEEWIIPLFLNSPDFKRDFNYSHVFIFEVENHG